MAGCVRLGHAAAEGHGGSGSIPPNHELRGQGDPSRRDSFLNSERSLDSVCRVTSPGLGAKMMTTGVVRFATFRLDARSGELFRDDRAVRLPPQASKLLDYLASSSGELVGREEIQKALRFEEVEELRRGSSQERARLGERSSSTCSTASAL